MSLKSAPFYWVECDAADCAARCPTEDSEFVAWADEDQALMCASDSDWTVTDAGEHYCWDHAPDEDEDVDYNVAVSEHLPARADGQP